MKNRKTVLLLLILVLLIGMATVACVSISLRLDVSFPQTTVVEYGESFEPEKPKAVIHAFFLHPEGIVTDAKVSVKGAPDGKTVGRFEVRYTAEFLFWTCGASQSVIVQDTVPPEISLVPQSEAGTYMGQPYEESGFTATDNYDGDITERVERTEKDGVVTYRVADSSGNETEVTREIHYVRPPKPQITLEGEQSMTVTVGYGAKLPGYSAKDYLGVDLTDKVVVTGSVDWDKVGQYEVVYTVEDAVGTTETVKRMVTVEEKPIARPAPVIPNGKTIYLTFDDGPSAHTGRLLDILKQYDVKATFFVMGNARIYPDYVRRIVDEGHSIGIHSVTHDYNQIYASEEAFFSDLTGMQSIIEELTGVKTYLMRFPGGSSNKVSSFNPGIMTRLTRKVEEAGFTYFDWNVSSGDAGATKSTKTVYNNVTTGITGKKVSVVLQHDSKDYSIDAVESIIKWGLANGYTFRTLDATSFTAHHRINN